MSPPTAPGTDRIRWLRGHLQAYPDDGHAWWELAQLLARQAPGEELYHALEQAIRSLPEQEETWLLAAQVHQRARGQAAAIRWLEHGAHQNPGLAAPLRALETLRSGRDRANAWARGDAYRQAGNWRKALDEYRSLERAHGQDPLLLNNIGSCLASLEQFDEAARCFDRALNRSPDFPEARLNVGLLCALRSDYDRADRHIGQVRAQAESDPAIRQAAETLQVILAEHRRLEPFLKESLRSGEMSGFHEAIQATPERLSRPHPRSVELLWTLADACRNAPIDPQTFRYRAETSALPFVETLTQCKLEASGPELYRICNRVDRPQEGPETAASHRRLMNMLQAVRDRSAQGSGPLHGPHAEARLKYWHARLLRDANYGTPGQYKLATNTIAGPAPTPPEYVSGTFRILLSEVRPSVPPGYRRAVFMLVATSVIHGFSDGNGRLARFLLAGEIESSGWPAIAIPSSCRAEVFQGADIALLEGDLQPLMEALQAAHAETERLLRQLQ